MREPEKHKELQAKYLWCPKRVVLRILGMLPPKPILELDIEPKMKSRARISWAAWILRRIFKTSIKRSIRWRWKLTNHHLGPSWLIKSRVVLILSSRQVQKSHNAKTLTKASMSILISKDNRWENLILRIWFHQIEEWEAIAH